jgi:hypothetical protein
MKVSSNGQHFQIGSFSLPDMHTQSINPFRVIPVMTAASSTEALLRKSYDVFYGDRHDLCLSPQNPLNPLSDNSLSLKGEGWGEGVSP